MLVFFCGRDDSSKQVPSTSFEPIDNRLPAQEGTQTSQKSASTSKSLRSNQTPVKNVDCHAGLNLEGTESNAVNADSVIVRLEQNSAVGAIGRILTR